MPPRTEPFYIANRKIAEQWRKAPVSELEWTRCDNQAGVIQGEAGGYFVQADGFPRRAYLKPANIHRNAASYARAAREKIASDLAFDLGLPVPPSQLTVREDPPDGCEKNVVVSLVMYPRQHPWQIVKPKIGEGEDPLTLAMASALSECGHSIAFDTWLGQEDHNDHPHNIVWGYDPNLLSDSKIVLLDYAFSMGYKGQWEGDKWKPVTAAPFPPRMREHVDPIKLSDILEKIRTFPESAISDIVMRIPDDYIDPQQKQLVFEALCGRRELVAGALTDLLSN